MCWSYIAFLRMATGRYLNPSLQTAILSSSVSTLGKSTATLPCIIYLIMCDTNNYATQLEYNLECKVQNKIESRYRPALVICCRLLCPPFLRNTGILSTFFLIQVV